MRDPAARIRRAVRRAARACLGAACYGMGVSWWVAYGTFYTAFGYVFAAGTMIVTTLLAVGCAVFAKEDRREDGCRDATGTRTGLR